MKKQKVWDTKKYIAASHQGSLDIEQPAMKKLIKLSKNSEKIIDLGCGDGTRLAQIANKKEGIGVDISGNAIKLAKKQYSNLQFVTSDLSKLPFENNKFDLAYSAYVLEHLEEPEQMLMEAIRVLRRGGFLLLVAPNYGAPNRVSPPNQESRIIKLIQGFARDILSIFGETYMLDWKKVKPITDKDYEMDYDTRVEPYLRTLKDFLQSHKMKIVSEDSLWDQELEGAKFHQVIFKKLGVSGLYPFKYWGPHLLLIAKK